MDKDKNQKIYRVIMLIIITVLITSLGTTYFTYKYLTKNGVYAIKSEDTSLSGLEDTLSNFKKEFESKYIGEINDKDLIDGAIKGYVEGLGDPYTTYYTKEEMDEILEETNGNYVGIGIYMTLNQEKNAITIIKPIENSPAEKAGILPGDIITKIDGEVFSGDQMDQASKKIRGENGTKVNLEILRGEEIKKFEVKREKVLISHITSKKLDNNIGYLAIEDFEGGCANEFKEKYKKLEKEGIKKLIIDIRNNGGGIVDEAIDILELITDKDSTLLITKDKNENEEIRKNKKEPIINMPIVVLMNEYSASASEILAGALKDNNKASLVGMKTYGKGVIQELHRLSDGSGLKITTNEYFRPSREEINKIGIKPDYEIDLTSELKKKRVLKLDEDIQLNKAIEILNEMK